MCFCGGSQESGPKGSSLPLFWVKKRNNRRKESRQGKQNNTPSFRVDPLRMVVDLYFEQRKDGMLVNIFDTSSVPFGIDGKKTESLVRVCVIAHCSRLSFEEKYEAKFIVGSPGVKK